MNENINKVRERITQEALTINTSLATVIEEYLNLICTNEKVATALSNPEKNIKELHDQIINIAKKKATTMSAGRGYFMPLEEMHSIIDKYYDLKTNHCDDVIDITDLL